MQLRMQFLTSINNILFVFFLYNINLYNDYSQITAQMRRRETNCFVLPHSGFL